MESSSPAALLQEDYYPHTFQQDTQFGDMDALQHVNNLAVGRYYESARVRLQLAVFGANMLSDNTLRLVLAEVKMRYLAEVHFPQQLVVGSGYGRIGNSSLQVLQGLFHEGSCVGLCESVMVATRDGRPQALDDNRREALRPYLVRLD